MPASAEDRLESWKEIAAYLRRGVRTVRRWERDEGLNFGGRMTRLGWPSSNRVGATWQGRFASQVRAR